MRKIVVLLMAFCFVFSCNLSVFAEDRSSKDPSVGDLAWDILWIRPLGVIGAVLGVTAYAISYPVTAFIDRTDEAKEILITDPYHYYFNRPLGEM